MVEFMRCLAFVLGSVTLVSALPPFSWEKVPLYVHCANQTGPLSPAFRARASCKDDLRHAGKMALPRLCS